MRATDILGDIAHGIYEHAAERARELVDVVTARGRARAAEQRVDALEYAREAEQAAHAGRIDALNAATRRKLSFIGDVVEKTRGERDEARRLAAERLAELTKAQE